ncbi:sensor histidine kinase [Chryseolinea soli]|nr:HAMP domain-containing sensor histidine kinase [Chryseolinea soli]
MRDTKIENEAVAQENVTSLAGLELVKAKGEIEQFIYSCSHTLRAPLKSIAGLVHLLKSSEGNPEIDPRFFLESIEKTCSKMELLLDDFEQFLANSRQRVATHPVDVREILEEVLQDFQVVIEEEHIQVSMNCDQTVPFYTDKNRFRVVLSHLISNAIQFRNNEREKMEVRIHVKVFPSFCTVQVRDNGVGIEDQVRSHIFDLFYRGSMQSTGSGVGLYIVKEVLNKMKGSITVRSTETKGSTFLISIPNLMP